MHNLEYHETLRTPLHWKFLNLKIKDKLLSFQWKIFWCSSSQRNIPGHLKMVYHWHTCAQELSLLFCSSLFSCRGEWQKWLSQSSAGDFPEQWEFFIDQL